MTIYCYMASSENLCFFKNTVRTDAKIIMCDDLESIPMNSTVILCKICKECAKIDEKLRAKHVNIIKLDVVMAELQSRIWKIYCLHEKYYLSNALADACHPTTSTLLLGSSYAKYGLSTSVMGNGCVNLGLDAQDVYYTCELGSEVIRKNDNIHTVIIASGYYWFFTDISRSTSDYAKGLIAHTYYPVLGKRHHASDVICTSQESILESNLDFFDESKLIQEMCNEFYRTMKESGKVTRSFVRQGNGEWQVRTRFLLPGEQSIPEGEFVWSQLADDAKAFRAKFRCDNHNALLAHKETYAENIKLLDEFSVLCQQHGVRLYILAMPMTVWYSKYLNTSFEPLYYEALSKLSGKFRFLNMSSLCPFDDSKFIDQDHLNSEAASYLTDTLKDIISADNSYNLMDGNIFIK